ncbi:MAG: hypothetical protein HYX47_23505 [Burkholderiales bacterium]|nr:hypothetical protein [Burkholderiales bacterium]
MQFDQLHDFADTPRKKLLWSALAVVAAFLLAAFYMVCSQQVQKAQMREAQWTVQRNAVTDCLDFMPKSTVGGCRQHLTAARGTDGGAVSAAMPVGFTYR